ncbi:hypothetical protein [Paenibacillus sp. ATY16]|uniref:hypothetical protein n=1 Tax=Paenibacillus sp. ATY16 TaxID=1759312 RepID=UPI00200BA4D4|nr:hypothetical protein [Paenibacillus sp. ATY16]MCK9862984.1 hypothetical protein [Paenibacillus sp. ATY16]
MKKFMFAVISVCAIVGFLFVEGLHFKITNAIHGDVKVIRTEDMGNSAKAVLFEDNSNHTFGVAKIEKKYGFLYRYDGGSYSFQVLEGKPFQASGIGDPESFVVAVKTADKSNIEYIAIGNHIEDIGLTELYRLSLDEVKSNPSEYRLQEVTDNYALFVFNGPSEDNWTIRGFSEDGKLVADKLFGGEERYVDWE